MKKKILLLIILTAALCNTGKAQIILDTVFTYGYPAGPSYNLIRLEKSGFKWLILDTAHNVTLLNMDHSIFKQFSYQVDPVATPSIFYMTEVLFDNDSTDIEFMLSYYVQAAQHRYVKIWDEGANLLFFRDSAMAAPWYGSGYSPNMLNGAITNTDSGAVMVLIRNEGSLTNLSNEVYRLPGYLECSACVDPLRLMESPNFVNPGEENRMVNFLEAYPNPSSGKTTIEYDLPLSYEKGTMDILDMQGNLIRSYKINRQFKNIIIEKNELRAGTYTCIIKAGEKLISKKFIRIN